MTLHLQRKWAQGNELFPYQRLSYDLVDAKNDNITILELSTILNEFAKRSKGEFSYFITDSQGVLYGENFKK